MFKPFVEENIFDRIISTVVAKDDEHGFELRSSGGRSRSGHRYYIHGGDLGKNERCPSVKADTIAEAIAKANTWLMQKKETMMKTGPQKLKIKGVVCVKNSDDPLQIKGRLWETYIPENENDQRIFERAVETGEIIQTQ